MARKLPKRAPHLSQHRLADPHDELEGTPELTSTTNPPPKIEPGQTVDADEWAEAGAWVKVHSSNVKEIMYDKLAKELHVRFIGGNAHYKYLQVSPEVAKLMFRANSMGKFVWKRLRGKYPYARVM